MIVKEEPTSPIPSVPKKCKGFSTDANAIRQVDPIEIDIDPPQMVGKLRKTVASGSKQVLFNGVAVLDKPNPVPRATRKSTRVPKARGRKDPSDLFSRLAQEFRALAKTCEELGEAMD